MAGAAADMAAWPINRPADDAEALLTGLIESSPAPQAVFVGGVGV